LCGPPSIPWAALHGRPAHNFGPGEIQIDLSRTVGRAHTWPDHLSDQRGLLVTVEQGHCTLAAVKRYCDTSVFSGRHNFSRLRNSAKENKQKAFRASTRSVLFMKPITQKPEIFLQIPHRSTVGHLPGRGVSLIKKGLRLVWSRIIAL